MDNLLRFVLTLLISALSVGNINSVEAAKKHEGLLAAYVVLGQSTSKEIIGIARAIISADNSCSDLEFDWKSDKNEKVVAITRTNPSPTNFPVKVCETLYNKKAEEHFITLKKYNHSLKLPKINLHPEKIAVIGDTGCKSKCKKEAKWPFPNFSKALANQNPDLLLHMGDYNYRGTPGSFKLNDDNTKVHVYDAGDNDINQCKKSETWPYYSQNNPAYINAKADNWKDWYKDLFKPAALLMSKAPWVVLRGNHELCSRAGPGWFYFLDPNSNLISPGSELSCPDQSADSENHYTLSPTYQLKFKNNLNLIVADNANACDNFAVDIPLFKNAFIEQSNKIKQFAVQSQNVSNWLMIHRPVWGARTKTDGQLKKILNKTMQKYLNTDPSSEDNSSLKNVDLILSGHMHLFESINFPSDNKRPVQLVLGNGGVALSKSTPPSSNKPVTINSKEVYVWGVNQFGYMTIDHKASSKDWTGTLIGVSNTITKCKSPQKPTTKTVCGY
ncbi:MAG: metallophosphoesterase [Magnetococcales bacterium]|nr:metallophosphoesterase [Magnetococcales bacterium]